jgi:hypothetical protein
MPFMRTELLTRMVLTFTCRTTGQKTERFYSRTLQAVLSGGKASIVFDPSFTASLASEESLVITVTPVGPSNGVYLDGVTKTGFSIAENNAGKSNITVHYIAIGKRAGYENPVLAKEVVDPSYQDKLSRGLHSDAELQTDGEGLYYENGQLAVGIHPSTILDPSVLQDPAPANKPRIQVQQNSGVNEASPFTGSPEEK